jgi:UrcA family protein
MRKLIAPAALASGLMLCSAALAATPAAAAAETATTTVTAPVVQREVVGRTTIGAPIDQLTVSQPVSYADLNLANPADVKVLDQRIRSTAQKDCAELRDVSPGFMDPTISGGHCVRSAERDARSTLSAMTSAANALQ